MPYTSQTDLEERFGSRMLIDLTDRGETFTGVIDTDVVDRAIADADALIDGYVAGRYQLPFSAVPDPIPALARSITIYLLHVGDPSQKIVRDYEHALKTLGQISAGTVALKAAGIASPGSGGHGARATDRTRDFTAATMKGFI